MKGEKSYPGQPRFEGVKTILHVLNRSEYADRCTFDTRISISSAPLDIERLASGARGHWGVESMHWLLDVEFKDDLSRYRAGNGAKNMAVIRRFALGLVRANKTKGSVKTRRKSAGWSNDFVTGANSRAAGQSGYGASVWTGPGKFFAGGESHGSENVILSGGWLRTSLIRSNDFRIRT